MAYTDIDKPSDYFNTKLFSGNGSGGHAITSVGFAPNWVWLKKRDGTPLHHLYDTIRGVTKMITSVDTREESTQTNGLTAFGSDGFTVGSDADINSGSMVSWNWKAGTSFTNDASGTGIGSIDSTGSVNTDAGFSIVKWVGTASNATIAHGLGTTPSVFISKSMAGAHSWGVYHKSIGIGSTTLLNSSGASDADATYYGGTSPTSTIMGLGTANAANASGNMIGYAFAEKQGYSKFKSYIGNNNVNGPLVYTGFKPAWVMLKSSGENGWSIYDNKRSPFNLCQNTLLANTTGVEQTSGGNGAIDILSNGFKIKNTDAGINSDGVEYIYMAFAENPFTTSTGVPATAR